MDDLIVIILTLIFIVAGFFGQVKKQRAAAGGNANVPPPGTDHLDFEDEEWEETFVPRPKMEPRVNAQEIQMNAVFSPENEGQSILSRATSPEIRSRRIVKTGKKKKFPLREAVIYSEILKQKYF